MEKAKRGRPPRSDEQVVVSRERIVAAARSLFAEAGYEGVSMRKIASKAGCLPSTLYTLFPNKRRLLHFLWASIFADLRTALDATYASSPESDRVAALCLTTIEFWLQRPQDYKAIFLVEDNPEGADDEYFAQSAQLAEHIGVIHRAVSEAQLRRELAAGDTFEITNVLLCCIQGVAYNLIGIPEYPWGDPKKIGTAVVHAALAGLR